MSEAPDRGLIARGLGRSYGDLAQNAGGAVLDLTGLKTIRRFDQDAGILTVDAGRSLAKIIELCLPAGWFLPVVPGTRQVTVGGAVACDVHGKNHHRDGSFGRHVLSLTLLTPTGEIRELDPERTPDEFQATVGGLGLTGVILAVSIRLLRIETAEILVTTERAPSLDDALERLAATDHLYRYSVAWIDCAAPGRRFGRSVLMRGDHATPADLPPSRRGAPLELARRRGLGVPVWASAGPLIRNATLAAFNELYYRVAREAERAAQQLDPFFFPLDAVRSWNRLYGRGGFLQYQFVVPFGAEDTLRRCVRMLGEAGQASFLAVLKRFGQPSGGHLSFPTPGWTLALDVPIGAAVLGGLLDRLDEEVLAAGGREYLAKDSRLPASAIAHMYPRLDQWREIKRAADPHGVFTSDLARRLGL